MPKPPPPERDPSEVRSPLHSHDPRSGLWRQPMMPGPYGGFEEAADFREERGYWPPGTPMRQQEDEKLDRYGDSADRPVFAREPNELVEVLTKAFRQELIVVGIGDETLLSASLERPGGVRWVARQMVYQLSAFVLREDLPPVTAEASRTFEVSILQVSPATWVDHWKLTFGHRWWCRWLVARRPARTVDRPQSRHVKLTAEFDLDRHRLYPRAPRSAVGRFGEPVVVAVVRGVR